MPWLVKTPRRASFQGRHARHAYALGKLGPSVRRRGLYSPGGAREVLNCSTCTAARRACAESLPQSLCINAVASRRLRALAQAHRSPPAAPRPLRHLPARTRVHLRRSAFPRQAAAVRAHLAAPLQPIAVRSFPHSHCTHRTAHAFPAPAPCLAASMPRVCVPTSLAAASRCPRAAVRRASPTALCAFALCARTARL